MYLLIIIGKYTYIRLWGFEVGLKSNILEAVYGDKWWTVLCSSILKLYSLVHLLIYLLTYLATHSCIHPHRLTLTHNIQIVGMFRSNI